MRILKLGISYLHFLQYCLVYLIFFNLSNISFHANVEEYIPEYISIEREHQAEINSGSSFFLVQILKTFPYTWRMTSKLSLFYQPNLVGMGDLCFQDGKSWISILYCTIFLLLKRVKSVWLHSWKSMKKFHFLRSLLQNRRS